jgi:hypothetical protein
MNQQQIANELQEMVTLLNFKRHRNDKLPDDKEAVGAAWAYENTRRALQRLLD